MQLLSPLLHLQTLCPHRHPPLCQRQFTALSPPINQHRSLQTVSQLLPPIQQLFPHRDWSAWAETHLGPALLGLTAAPAKAEPVQAFAMQRSAHPYEPRVPPTLVVLPGPASSPACHPTLLPPHEDPNFPTFPLLPKRRVLSRSKRKRQPPQLPERLPNSKPLSRLLIVSEAHPSVQESIGTRWRTKMAVFLVRSSNSATDRNTKFPHPTMAHEAKPMMARPSPRRSASRTSLMTAAGPSVTWHNLLRPHQAIV